MANEFIIKNGLIVSGETPENVFSSSMLAPNITDVGTTYPQHYVLFNNTTKQWFFYTGSFVSFIVNTPIRNAIVTTTGTNNLSGTTNNGSGDIDTSFLSFNSVVDNSTPGSGFIQTLYFDNSPSTAPVVTYWYPTEVNVAPNTTNASIFTNVSDTVYDGMYIEYLIRNVGGTTLRRTGVLRASWNRSTSSSFVDVAAPSIGNVDAQLTFNINKTAGNVQLRATATSTLSSTVKITCAVKLFSTNIA